MSKPKTCQDCQHSEIDRGYGETREDPGFPDALLCKISDDSDIWQDIFEIANPAESCTFFEPIVAEACGYCRKPIGMPRYQCEHQLNHWYSGDAIAVCSIECQEALDRQWMEEVASEE